MLLPAPLGMIVLSYDNAMRRLFALVPWWLDIRSIHEDLEVGFTCSLTREDAAPPLAAKSARGTSNASASATSNPTSPCNSASFDQPGIPLGIDLSVHVRVPGKLSDPPYGSRERD